MTNEQAIKWLKDYLKNEDFSMPQYEQALEMAIQALSQEPCELLIIKSDIFLHQDDRKKWMESIKREKESGVIILPPYFEPLLVPANIEINIEQKPCDDAISRDAVIKDFTQWRGKLAYTVGEDYSGVSLLDTAIRVIKGMPSVTQKSGKWDRSCTCSVCGQWRILESEKNGGKYKFCPNCGARMYEPQERSE